MPPIDDLAYLTTKSKSHLNHRQALDYNAHRKQLIEWLQSKGKDPDQEEGLADRTASNYASRIDRFYRWVWTEFEGYTTRITHDQISPSHAPRGAHEIEIRPIENTDDDDTKIPLICNSSLRLHATDHRTERIAWRQSTRENRKPDETIADQLGLSDTSGIDYSYRCAWERFDGDLAWITSQRYQKLSHSLLSACRNAQFEQSDIQTEARRVVLDKT